jgi:hypothetical protein
MSAGTIAALAAGIPALVAAIVAIIASVKSLINSAAALESSVRAHQRLNAIGAPPPPEYPTTNVVNPKGPGR